MLAEYYAVMLVAFVIAGGAQLYVKATYGKYSRVPLMTGRTGAEIARSMLDSEGLHEVGIELVPGTLTDHYDPRRRMLGLSQDVYAGRTIAAAGVAAHEAGHAVQHARSYAFASVRQAMVPVANVGSSLGVWLILLGVFLGGSGLAFLVDLGIVLFLGAVLFTIVTLPVEFDASRRAVTALATGYLPPDQVAGARAVLRAASLTYVAAALTAILQLVYFLGLARRR